MRSLLTCGTLVAAMLVPWSSLAPSWLSDVAGSPVSPSTGTTAVKSGGPAARLNPALGILPINAEESSGVVCENGVCRLVHETASRESAAAVTVGPTREQEPKQNLESLGATQIRVESGPEDGDSRASCFMPVRPGSRVLRWFKATGTNDAEALTLVLKQVEAWLQDHE